MDVKSLRRSASTMEEDQLSTVKVEGQTTGFRFVGDYKDDLIIDVEKSVRKVTLPEPIQEEKMKPPGQHQEQMMLDKQLLLTVCRIKGVVDIRYLNDDLRKTIRGVKLSTSQFQAITNNLPLIDEVFTNLRIEMRKNGGSILLEDEKTVIDLGEDRWMYIGAPYQTVHIRRQYRNEIGELCLDACVGVSLKWKPWKEFMKVCQTILTSGMLSNHMIVE